MINTAVWLKTVLTNNVVSTVTVCLRPLLYCTIWLFHFLVVLLVCACLDPASHWSLNLLTSFCATLLSLVEVRLHCIKQMNVTSTQDELDGELFEYLFEMLDAHLKVHVPVRSVVGRNCPQIECLCLIRNVFVHH